MDAGRLSDPPPASGAENITTASRIRTRSFASALLVIGSFYVFQKLAIPLGGKNRIQFALLMMYAILVYLILTGRAYIHVIRCIVFFGCIVAAIMAIAISQTTEPSDFSLASFALFVAIYLPCAFVIPMERGTYHNVLRSYVALGLIFSGLIAFNWTTNIAKLGLPINLDKIIPEPAIFREYVYIQPIAWKSLYMKPNAVFFLETSVLSQFIASALVIEICFFRRVIVLGIFSIALVATFGGTGFLLVVLVSPFILYYINANLVLSGLVGAPIVLGVAYGIGLLDNIIRRSGDFDRQGSSADDRFVKQFHILIDFFNQDLYYIAFGHGPGSLSVNLVSVYFIPIVKALYEYGLVFAIIYLVLTVTICFGRGVPLVIGAIGFTMLHILNAAFLVPIFVYVPMMMGGGYWLAREGEGHPFSGNSSNIRQDL